MAKKLIFLLLIIPIIVMLLLFFATKTVSNFVDIAVTGVEIVGEDTHVYLDMDKGETYSLEYAVYPTTAKNKSVFVTTEPISGEHLATLEFSEGEGKFTVTPKSAGAAKVTITTVDGGFKDSIIVHVDSTKLQSITASVDRTTMTVGDTTSVKLSYFPENPSNTLVDFVSSNPKVAEVNAYGVIRAVSKGTATITAVSEFDPNITSSVEITVRNKDAMDLGKTEITSFASAGSIPISIASDDAITKENISYRITYTNGNDAPLSLISAELIIDGSSVSLDYTFNDESFIGDLIVKITFNGLESPLTKECRISRINEIKVSFNKDGAFEFVTEQENYIPFTLTPEDSEVTYSVSASNDNVSVRMSNNGRLIVLATRAGVTKVTLTVSSVLYPDQVKTIECDVVIKPRAIDVTESANQYGIENKLAIGGYEYSGGALIPSANGQRPLSLSFSTKAELGEGFYENFFWESSSPEVNIDKNGVISFVNDTFAGDVEFTACFSYGGIEKRTASYTVTCIANGVNVYTYEDLYLAATSEKPVVLRNNIKEGFGYIGGELKYTEMKTTYDSTYYKNVGREDEAKVKILVEFKNDVYGNGYIINAHEITYKLIDDGNGGKLQDESALFQGPLNFVMIKEDNGATISVKAQDNICFALHEGVTVRNVELRGCDLEHDADTQKTDLTHLNYIGTTVEVLGDDVTIAYSRLTNGRTVLRAFGDDDDSEKEITVNITNSVLSGAREFIMRIGSNRFFQNSSISPSLPGDTNKEYNSKKEYHTFTPEEKAAYDEKYINTYVNVRNSIFKDSGLFAIGMDSHFASQALADGSKISNNIAAFSKYLVGWNGLSKTSYGAKLSFTGEVQMYSWKDIEDVDSSTLIEIKGNSMFKKLSLDIKEMINQCVSKPNYSNIITEVNVNGKKVNYVHAGIAFFGGGKNYSVFESEQELGLGRYEISLGDAGRAELTIAAGDEPFYFFLYNKDSAFTPKIQEEKLASNEAYKCIYEK